MGHRFVSAATAVLIAAVVTTAVTAASGQAQNAPAPPKPALNKTLVDAAGALGMVRGLARSLEVVNMFEFTATGTIADPAGGDRPVSRLTAGYDYVIPAIRLDVETAAPDARRAITVAAGALAWDEATPGVYRGRTDATAAERLRPIWLMPHGVILAGARAPDKVTVKDQAGGKELSVALPDGTAVTSRLDAKNLPIHVEFSSGGHLLTGDYADYRDYQGYGVMFPSHIVHKIDGRVVADLSVTEALANPYLIFPAPQELARRP